MEGSSTTLGLDVMFYNSNISTMVSYNIENSKKFDLEIGKYKDGNYKVRYKLLKENER